MYCFHVKVSTQQHALVTSRPNTMTDIIVTAVLNRNTHHTVAYCRQTTGNVTEVRSENFGLVRRYVARPGDCYYHTLLCCDAFSSSSVVSRAFSALCVYSTFVSNFVSVAASIAELAMQKNCVLNQSFNHSAYLMSREPKLSLRNNNHRH